ncbi:MAG: CRISPR-associated ring nuclease Csm6 [Pseudomonadota bacterium]|nr:CRISPR-associated ring nuclease Csm6 [Pseudomonadota bacterium]
MNPAPTPRRILLAVTGLTPQVVTETLYALACRKESPWVPDEIHLITTATGAENARLNLLLPGGWFHRLCADYQLPAIDFLVENIHILTDAAGRALDDIRTPEQNTLAADFITETVRRLTETADSELHVSIAGGRKTMGYYLGYALSLYGRLQDRLSHVLVSDPYETNREFYYPTPYDHPIHSRRGDKEITVDARNAQVDLADIPFVRLREGLPERLLTGTARFSQAVAAAQCSGREISLTFDLAAHTVTAGGEAVKLTPQNFTLLLWLARRRLASREPVHCRVYDSNRDAAHEYLALCRELFGAHGHETERAESGLKNGMDSTWFSPAKSRLNKALVKALGENGAQPYCIHPVGKRSDARFGLTLGPDHIRVQE